ncbi:MAG: ABC transporter permease [Propionibacteriaceae bacterium]
MRSDLLLANARQQLLYLRHDSPWPVWLTGQVFPTVIRAVIYCLLARLAYGDEGLHLALSGIFFLAVTTDCLAGTADIPVLDKYLDTFGQLHRSRMRPFGHYIARAIPLGVRAFATCLVVVVVTAAVLGEATILVQWASSLWLAIPAIFGCVAFGFVVIGPAIGTSARDLFHNGASIVILLFSGAIVPASLFGPLAQVGQVLPLTHALNAFRLSVSGESFAHDLVLEGCVGTGWLLIGYVLYRLMAQRGLRTGRGAFV